MSDKHKDIIKNMYGSWEASDAITHYDKETDVTATIELSFTLTIDADNMHFMAKRNGEINRNVVEKVSGAHWTGHNNEYLHFMDGHEYFIEDANETDLKFGILHNKGVFDGHQSYIDFKRIIEK